jgi:hypothetical protein
MTYTYDYNHIRPYILNGMWAAKYTREDDTTIFLAGLCTSKTEVMEQAKRRVDELNADDTFTVSLMTDYGWTETCHPLAVGVDKATAKSIYRHYNRPLKWNSSTYVLMVSRKYCTNHEDFEKETTIN